METFLSCFFNFFSSLCKVIFYVCDFFIFNKTWKKYFLDFSLVWYIHVYVYSMISIFRCELDSVRRSKLTFNSLMICQIRTCTNMNHSHVSVTYTKLTRLLFENTWQFMFLSSFFLISLNKSIFYEFLPIIPVVLIGVVYNSW